jgi:antitoxin CcdA
VSIDADLLDEAREAGANLSAVLETALMADLRERRWQKWRQENKQAIEESNAELDRNGMWYEPDWLRKRSSSTSARCEGRASKADRISLSFFSTSTSST